MSSSYRDFGHELMKHLSPTTPKNALRGSKTCPLLKSLSRDHL